VNSEVIRSVNRTNSKYITKF